MPTSFLLLPFAPRWFVVDCLKGGPLVISAHVGSELINNRLRIEPPFTPCQESANKRRKAKERVCGARAVLFFFFFLSWRFIRMDNLIRVTFDSCLRLFSLSLSFNADSLKRILCILSGTPESVWPCWFFFCFVLFSNLKDEKKWFGKRMAPLSAWPITRQGRRAPSIKTKKIPGFLFVFFLLHSSKNFHF